MKIATEIKKELVSSLEKAGADRTVLADAEKGIFGTIDNIARLAKEQSLDKTGLKAVANAAKVYIQDTIDAQEARSNEDFQGEWQDYARKTFEESLKKQGIADESIKKLGLDQVEWGMSKLGLVSHVGSGEEIEASQKPAEKKKAPAKSEAEKEASNGVSNASESQEMAESLADNTEVLQKTFDSVLKKFISIEDSFARDEMMEDFFKLFKGMGEGEEANFDPKELEKLAELFEKAAKEDNWSSPEIKLALSELSDGAKFALTKYVTMLKDATVGKGLGFMAEQSLKDPALQKEVASALYGVKTNPGSSLESGLSPENLLQRKANIAQGVVLLAKSAEIEIKELESMGVNVDRAQIFAKTFTAENIKAVVQDQMGMSIGDLYRDDISNLREYLDKSDAAKTPEKAKNNVEKLFKDYGKYMFAAAPFFLAPLAGLLQKIPVLGKPAADILNWGYGLFEKAGMPLMTVMLTQGFMGGNAQQNKEKQEAEATATT